MIDINNKYALTKSGEVLVINAENGDRREIDYERGKYKVYYDEFFMTSNGCGQALRREEIIETSNDYDKLDKMGIALGRKTEREAQRTL